MTLLAVPKETLEKLIAGEGVNDLTYVDAVYDGEWRWGAEYTLIFKDSADRYWSYPYRVQVGDNYYNSVEDEYDPVQVQEVFPHSVTTIVYRTTPQ